GAAHGGIGAMIADQLVALTAHLLGRVCVTRSLQIRYRRPMPLDTELELEAWSEAIDDKRSNAWCTVSAGGKVVLEGTAELGDAGAGLVQKQEPGFQGDEAGELDDAAGARGQGADLGVAVALETHHGDELTGARVPPTLGATEAE